MNWRTSGDTTLASFRDSLPENSVIKKRGEVEAVFLAVSPYTRFFRGVLQAESSGGIDFNAVPASYNNPVNMRIRGQAPFQQFDSLAECAAEMVDRITSKTYAYKNTQTIEEFVHVWAPSSDNNDEAQYVRTVEAVIASLPLDEFTSPVEPGGPQMPTQPTIIITAGHRSDLDSGNPNEKDRTDDMARAYRDVFTAAGFATHYLQNEDGDNRPDITTGGLDTVGQKTRSLMQSIAGPEVLFDCHFEGAIARGVFAIVPDETGLTTAVAGGAPGNDTWANNPLDVALARSISKKISIATGLPLRSTTEAGVMSERATGVGGQGYRLAMFAYTVPVRDRAVRLVVEHGSLPVAADLAIVNTPGFYTKCAGAALAAVMEVYELGAVIVEPPVVVDPPSQYAPRLTYPWLNDDDGVTIQKINGVKVYPVKNTYRVIGQTPRKQATGRNTKKVGPDLMPGETFEAGRAYRSGSTTYVLTPMGTRVKAADLLPRVQIAPGGTVSTRYE